MTGRTVLSASIALVSMFGLSACAAEKGMDQDEAAAFDDRCSEDGVQCQGFGRKNYANKPPAYELGTAERAPTLTVIYQGHPQTQPVDVEFNPKNPSEVWIAHYASSHATILRNPGAENAEVIERRDAAYSHFMRQPPAIAMGAGHEKYNQTFATCGDGDNGGNYFMGPTLYVADADVFVYQNKQTGLGSHLDMLHSTSYCRGIAWGGTGNQYWAFNAMFGSIDFYDFNKDHDLGWDDHSDGVIRRYADGQLKGVDGVMSHLSVDHTTNKVYVADTGNKRILVLDPTQATPGASFRGSEPIVERRFMDAPIAVLPTTGLEAPSGIEASGGLVFVTDAATSKIHAFDMQTGANVRTLETGLPAGSLAGLNFGPDGKIYFVDRVASRVVRIDP
jgi:hypothetical protein